MKPKALSFSCMITVLCLMASPVCVGAIPDYPVKGKVVNVLACFDNPEGALFSMDGDYLFISNSALHGDANKPFGWVEGAGSISKLEVGASGSMKMVDPVFIKDLTGPLGMACLNVNLQNFPRGTIFATAGSGPMAAADGTPITDQSRHKPKILAFDPGSGEILGEMDLGATSAFAKISGGPVMLVNALAFDKTGNLYVVDTGFGHDTYQPAFKYCGGTWKIPAESVAPLLKGEAPPSPPQFIPNPSWPDGVEVSPDTGEIWINTVMPVIEGVEDPYKGGIWALRGADFEKGVQPDPLFTGLGRLDGLDFTVRGTNIQTEIGGDPNSVVVVPKGGTPHKLVLEPDVTLSGPADVDIKTLADGSYLLVVPELTALDPTPWDDDVTVIWLPNTFD